MDWIDQADIPCISFYEGTAPLVGAKLRSHFGKGEAINPDQWYYWNPAYDTVNPMLIMGEGRLLKLKETGTEEYRHEVEITAMQGIKGLFAEVLERNRFCEVTPELQLLGITKRLVEQIPIGHQFFGTVEFCMCGVADCYRREAWIIRLQDGFAVPFCYRIAMPSSWMEHRLEKCEPDHGFTIDFANEVAEKKEYTYFQKRDQEFPLPALVPGYRIPSDQLSAFNPG
jgi:hypothetical protein